MFWILIVFTAHDFHIIHLPAQFQTDESCLLAAYELKEQRNDIHTAFCIKNRQKLT